MRQFHCPIKKIPLVWLGVDEFIVIKDDTLVKTILGSCVSIIIYDLENNVFGINHFLNPEKAVELCQKMLEKLKDDGGNSLKSIIVGGANKNTTHYKVGITNIDYAKDFLKKNNIAITSEYLGGETGRTVSFNFENGEISLNVKSHDIIEQNDKIESIIETEYMEKIKESLDRFKEIYEKS
jgi:chemotaxis protein CheD